MTLTLIGCGDDPSAGGPSFAAHCRDESGDLTCATFHGGRPYCNLCVANDAFQGCVGAAPIPECRPGNVGTATLGPGTGDGDTGTDSGTTVSVDDTSSTTSSLPACAGTDGSRDEDCEALDPATPYCMGGACVDCETAGGDDFCVAADALAPACSTDTGACAPCGDVAGFVCGAETSPYCDASGACLPCSEHAHCPGTACHLDDADDLAGRCFEQDEIIWVDNGVVCPGMGTEISPFCNLGSAVGGLGGGSDTVVMLTGGGFPYTHQATLDTNKTVALIGVDQPMISGQLGLGEASFIAETGFLYVHGVHFANNSSSHGIGCEQAVVWLQLSESEGNAGYGVYGLGPCTWVIDRTRIYGNTEGGIRGLGGTLRVENTTVGLNGDGVSGPGLNLQYTDADVVYSTFAGNDSVGADSIKCLSATGEVRNSVVVGADPSSVELDCFTMTFDFNAIDAAGFTGPEGALVGAYNPAWFVDPAGGDFRLAAPPLTPFGDVASWKSGDPELDADGTPRPMDDNNGYAGVDEP